MRQLPSVRRALTNEHVQSIRDYIVCRRVDRTAFLRNVQRIAECIVHFFLIEELVAEDDQLVIVDEPHHSLSALGCGFSYHRRALVQGRTHLLHARPS